MHIQRRAQSLSISVPFILAGLASLMIVIASVLTSGIHTYAAETIETDNAIIVGQDLTVVIDRTIWPYYGSLTAMHTIYTDDEESKGTTHTYDIAVYSKYPLYVLHNSSNNSYSLKAYNPDTGTALAVSSAVDYITADIYLHEIYDVKSGDLTKSQSWSNDGFFSPSVILSGSYPSFGTSLYVFDTDADAKAYFETGDTSGVTQEPDPEYKYDYDHDFTKDEYDPDIPVPILSNLTHNSFHVDNADDTRDLEIYVESTFYGLSHNPGSITKLFTIDKDWVFNTHRYNLTNTDVSYSDADIDINEKFGVDNIGILINDLKRWSLRYPTHYSLPDCDSFNHQSDEDYGTQYKFYHTLIDTGQVTTVYKVRFCQYVAGEGYTYGQWSMYTLSSNGEYQGQTTTGGSAIVDPDTGDLVNDPDDTTSDTTGDSVPTIWDTIIDPSGELDVDFSDAVTVFKNALSNIKEFITEFASFSVFLASAITFIPGAIWMLIFTGISLSMVGLIIKTIMAVVEFVKP